MGLTIAAGLVVLAVLALILITTTREAWPAFSEMGLSFITSKTWDPPAEVFGALAFIFGTALVSLIALIFAVPVSLGIALFLTELAPRRLRAPAVTVIDLLAAIPSVVFGLWGVLVVAPNLVPVYRGINDVLGGIPVIGSVFAEPVGSGRSFMTAGLILAIMITPIITSISREVFSTVPRADKDAALALGATKWEMIKGAVFPHSFGGIVGAVILGLGRAMGETIAVALIIGGSTQITANVFASGNAMPAVIVDQIGESTGTFTAALIGLGVVLFALTVIINTTAQSIVRRAEIRMKGAAS
ncbi:phosphate ABC transporter permease subunit PstC [Phytohabitans rumicis]|uniref:phosphate ABC transporter permease subunit PstC n=2 Tax=Phytohabitans rumicis TaxID=1076125 RepID=UPI0031E6C94D